jgi:osmoprotectant transport system permease protein
MTAISGHHPALRFDKLGVIVAAIGVAALTLQPFNLFRANRIVLGEPHPLWTALPPVEASLTIAAIVGGIVIVLLRTPNLLRLGASLAILALLGIMVGRSATYLIPADNSFARVSPGSGFWLLIFAFALTATDALVRLRLGPIWRIGLLVLASLALGLLLVSGALNDLSILMEYANRADAFWRQLNTHIFLAFGSLAAATLVGVPVGILCYRVPRIRAGILNSLNIVQTIPSIALFGLLIAPMAWIGSNVPGASALGIAGIGVAPALVALFAYSLLPVVSNTVVGLDSVPRDANDAARGMGMTDGQRLRSVELPLAFPVILTGIRIVLVQNIGLAVIAGLIGGGGLGTFVFQGITQTAMDLVLLGAIPAVALAFAAAIVLDALVELSQPQKRKGQRA